MKKTKLPKQVSYITFISAILILVPCFLYLNEITKKPILEEKIESKDAAYLTKFYLKKTPNIDGRIFLGKESAPITIISYLDLSGRSSIGFIEKTFPTIKGHIDSGEVRFYHKYHLTTNDITGQTKNYILSRSLYCIGNIQAESYYDIYFDMILKDTKIEELIKEYNLSDKEFSDCMAAGLPHEILEDISEAENLGVVGINPKLYIGIDGNDNTVLEGVPRIEQLNRVLRQKETIVGY